MTHLLLPGIVSVSRELEIALRRSGSPRAGQRAPIGPDLVELAFGDIACRLSRLVLQLHFERHVPVGRRRYRQLDVLKRRMIEAGIGNAGHAGAVRRVVNDDRQVLTPCTETPVAVPRADERMALLGERRRESKTREKTQSTESSLHRSSRAGDRDVPASRTVPIIVAGVGLSKRENCAGSCEKIRPTRSRLHPPSPSAGQVI